MDITSASERRELVDWAREVSSTLGERRDEASVRAVGQAIDELLADRFCLALMGKAKRGKSTLLNAILGRRDDLVAPVDKLPASSAISRFRWADRERATVVFRDGRREQIGFDRVREFVTEEFNKENVRGVDVVDIEGPFGGLDHDLELVDTPGAGSIHEYHDAILHAFIPRADAVIFLVTARMPLDRDELELLQKVKAADIQKIFFAVNKVDESSEQDIADAIAHNMRLLSQAGVHIDRMHRVSAKAAFKGDSAGSGVMTLMEEISTFLAANRGRVLSTRFISRVSAAVEPIAQAIKVELASSRKSVGELDTELATLRQKKTAVESERDFAEREFSMAWSKAVDAYERALKEAKTEVAAAVMTKVHRASVFDVSALAKQLPTLLTQTIEEHLRPAASQFEEAARESCDRLQASYPALNVGDAGSVALRTREGHTTITGAAGGVAVAATGIGFAAVGMATAASIAAANATAAAATMAVTAPSLVTGLGTLLGSLGAPPALTGLFSLLGTGTATVAAPTAMTVVPLWVALAGPIGWTVAGIGVLAVPFSWRLSKLKMKDKIEEACEEQINKVFGRLQTERLPAIRNMGKAITEEIRLRLDRQLAQIEAALVSARDRRPSESEAAQLAGLGAKLHGLLAHRSIVTPLQRSKDLR